VSEGGETAFPRAEGFGDPADGYDFCKHAPLRVKPERGTAILWYLLTPDGLSDANSLHGACPAGAQEKWAANYWVWNKPTAAALKGRCVFSVKTII